MIKDHKIYGLFHPLTGELKYIGRTCNSFGDRLSCHLNIAKKSFRKNLLHAWICSILKLKLRPIIHLIEFCNENNVNEREIFWINFYKAKINLKNQQPGGNGNPKGYQFKKRYIPPKGVFPKHLTGFKNGKYIRNEDWRKNKSLTTKGKRKPKLNKKLIAKHVETGIEICFKNSEDASIYLNIAKQSITNCIKKRNQHIKKYTFKRLDSEYQQIKTQGQGIRKKVYLYIDKCLHKSYNSILEAAKDLNMKRDTIMSYCSSKKNKKGFTWSYECL